MRALVQRVSHASVSVDGQEIASIGRGLLVFVGVGQGDGSQARSWLARKLLGLRVFEHQGKMHHSVTDIDGELLVVSQFTLYGDVTRGQRPSFTAAMEPGAAAVELDALVAELRAAGGRVATGRFGATMHVSLVNDGPVTLWLESPGGENP